MTFDKGFENVVYNCDCLDLMREMIQVGVKVDWCIADPPYNIGFSKIQGGDGVTKAQVYDIKEWDDQRWTKEYFDLIFQVSKNVIIFGGNYYTDILPPTKSWIVWDKCCDDKFRNDFADCELRGVQLGKQEYLDIYIVECCMAI